MPRTDPGAAEYAALVEAMETVRPACRDYELFTADEVDDAQLALAKRLCADCPLTAYCSAYAAASKPTVGIWAGVNYGPSKQRTKRKETRGKENP
ncbi:WhiB family transcriptional regulator [Microbacterium sp. CCNWLW134]|uniref:WhiB family transcriptional regulator n=1 Tax=Microbacterium sp. CCNWLW134 TaxID=3122064 RepID=UPI003010218B